jgi:hypothetical protein
MPTLIVKAIAKCDYVDLSQEDSEVPAETQVILRDEVPEHLLANAALDVFHAQMPVDNLDDFEFQVWLGEKQLHESDDADSYDFADAGDIA